MWDVGASLFHVDQAEHERHLSKKRDSLPEVRLVWLPVNVPHTFPISKCLRLPPPSRLAGLSIGQPGSEPRSSGS